jgi:kynurenine formamidase
MGRRIIDLSTTIEAGLPSDPEMMIPKIDYLDHQQGADQMCHFFPGLKKDQLPKGLGWAVEFIKLTTHSGTHMDAPFHYHPTMDQGAPALTIDEVPLAWCFQDGVLLDFSHKSDGDAITIQDLEGELRRINYTLKPLDIVLVRTGADAFWGQPDYLEKGAGMTRESTLYLIEQGIKVMGIDAWSWDRPLPYLAKEFQKRGDASVIWEAHFAGITAGYCHMEKLAQLDQIPIAHGFQVACFPIKIKNASGGWTRPVAIVND